MSEAAKRIATGLIAGLIFGLGLIISGMSNPAKVLNFLDVAGTWDPSLALVMGAAVVTTFLGYRLALARPKPLFDASFHMPTVKDVDASLVLGAALFGVGWGISGLCPGPALVSLPLLSDGAVVFVLAMIVGVWSARFTPKPHWPVVSRA